MQFSYQKCIGFVTTQGDVGFLDPVLEGIPQGSLPNHHYLGTGNEPHG